jgi:hypothetical protein
MLTCHHDIDDSFATIPKKGEGMRVYSHQGLQFDNVRMCSYPSDEDPQLLERDFSCF